MVHAHGAGALHQGLDNHCTDFVRLLTENLLHRLKLAAAVVLPGFARLPIKTIGAGCGDHFHQQGFVGFFIKGDIAHRQSAQGFAVVAVGQVDELALAGKALVSPRMKAHLDCYFDGGGTVVGKKTLAEAGGRDLHQSLRELDNGLVGEAGQNHVLQFIHLLLDAVVDARVAVAEQIDPPGTDRIDITIAVKVFQPDSLAASNWNHGQLLVVFHLGTGMPQGAQVSLH